jgi:uncharacterized protein YprB with RNaseH-like and TPR domain
MTDPAKIASDITIRQSKEVEKFGLSPLTGKICCISLGFSDNPIQTFISKDELIVLSFAAEQLSTYNYVFDRIVTFNGKSFDIPYLTIRTAINGILLKPLANSKYDHSQHLDVRNWLTNFDQYGRGTLEDWCIRFGVLDSYSGAKGSDIQSLYNEDKLQEIGDKCQRDVELLRKLYQKIERYIE